MAELQLNASNAINQIKQFIKELDSLKGESKEAEQAYEKLVNALNKSIDKRTTKKNYANTSDFIKDITSKNSSIKLKSDFGNLTELSKVVEEAQAIINKLAKSDLATKRKNLRNLQNELDNIIPSKANFLSDKMRKETDKKKRAILQKQLEALMEQRGSTAQEAATLKKEINREVYQKRKAKRDAEMQQMLANEGEHLSSAEVKANSKKTQKHLEEASEQLANEALEEAIEKKKKKTRSSKSKTSKQTSSSGKSDDDEIEKAYKKGLREGKKVLTPEEKRWEQQRRDSYETMADASIMNALSRALNLSMDGSKTWQSTLLKGLSHDAPILGSNFRLDAIDTMWASAGHVIDQIGRLGELGAEKQKRRAYEREIEKTDEYKGYLSAYEARNGSKKGASVRDFYKWDKENSYRARLAGQHYASQYNSAEKKLLNDDKALKRIGSSGLVFSSAMGAVIGLTSAVKGFAEESVRAYEKIQSLQTQLSVVYGSDSEAMASFNQIESYAKKSPFGVEVMTQQAILLKQSGEAGSTLMDTMARIGDMASGNAEKMRSISEVYARVLSSTTVTARDLRQLANAGVPAYAALAKSFEYASPDELARRNISSVRQGDLRSMLQGGKVTAEDFKRMIKYLTDEGGTFYGAVDRGAKTLKARKQNLDDAKEMGKAAVGEWIAKFRGPEFARTKDPWYSMMLNLTEGIYTTIEDSFGNSNKKNDYKDANANLQWIEKLLQTGQVGERLITLGVLSSSEYKNARQAIVDAGEALYQDAGSGDNLRLSQIKRLKEEVDAAASQQSIYDELNNQLLEDNPFATLKYVEGFEGMRYKDLLDLSKELEDYIKQNTDGNTTLSDSQKDAQRELHFTEHLNALAEKRGSDFNEWLQGKVDETISVANLRSKSKQAFDAGSYGSLLLNDAQYFRNEETKRRITSEMNKISKKGANGETILDTSLIGGISEFNQMLLDLAEPMGALKIATVQLFDEFHKVSDRESLEKLTKNLTEVFTVFENDAGRGRLGYAANKDIDEMKQILAKGTSVTEDEWNRFLALNEQFVKDINNNIMLSASQKEDIVNAFNSAFTDKEFTTEFAETINARQTSLWHNVLGNAIGVSADRVKAAGGAESFKAYADNFSQRTNFATIAKSLLQTGTTLKDISKQMVRTGVGYDGTQLFDWKKTMENLEGLAKSGNLETQQALAQAYQRQLDTITELETAGISTLDSWNELHDISQQLGTAFSLDIQMMNDGSYRFKESSIQAAEDLRKVLNQKSFELSGMIIANQKLNQLQSEGANLSINNSILSGGLGRYANQLSVNQRGVLADTIAEILKNNVQMGYAGATETLRHLGGSNAQRAYSLIDELGKAFNIEKLPNLVENTSGGRKIFSVTEQGYESLVAGYNETISELYNQEMKLLAQAKENMGIVKSTADMTDEELAKVSNEYKRLSEGSTGTVAKNVLERFLTTITGDTNGFALNEKGDALLSFAVDVKATSTLGLEDVEDDLLTDLFSNENISKMNAEQLRFGIELLEILGGYEDLVKKLTEQIMINNKQQELNYKVLAVGGAINALNAYANQDNTTDAREYGKAGRHDSRYNYAQTLWGTALDNAGVTTHSFLQELLGVDPSYDLAGAFEDLAKAQTEQFETNDDITKMLSVAGQALTYQYVSDGGEGNQALVSNNNALVSALRTAGMDDSQIEEFINALQGLDPNDIESARQTLLELQDQLSPEVFAEVVSALDKMVISSETIGMTWEKLGQDMIGILSNSAFSGFNTLTEQIGENWYNVMHNIKTGSEAAKDFEKALQGIGSELLNNVSASLQTAGLNIASGAALSGNWAMVAAGLGLAALGGLGNVFSGFLNAASQDNDKSDETVDRLSKLKDNLADLLSQARNDAEYYEVTLRNKSALTSNNNVSAKKVNDMVITPQGVFRTDPYDYIMAMKDPASLRGSAGGVPNINFMVVDQSTGGVNIEQSTSVDADGTVILMATISDYIEGKIANGDYNKAMATAQIKEKGNQVFA